jgi:hypothetical protein
VCPNVTSLFVYTVNCKGDNLLTLVADSTPPSTIDDGDNSLCASELYNFNRRGNCLSLNVSQSCFRGTINDCLGVPAINASYFVVQSSLLMKGAKFPIDPMIDGFPFFTGTDQQSLYLAIEGRGVYVFSPRVQCDAGFGFDAASKSNGNFPYSCAPCRTTDPAGFCKDTPSSLALDVEGNVVFMFCFVCTHN